MQYWIPKALMLSALVSLSGCGIFTSEAHHPRNYRTNEPVVAPEGLDAPRQDPTYKMDVARYDNSEQAKATKPPMQIMPLAEGSWLDENEKLARVYFDKNEGIEDLDEFIWHAIEGVLSDYNTQAVSADKLIGTVETDWFSIVRVEEGWLWDDEIVAEQRYKFIIEEKDHQRTAALRAEMVDYRSDDVPLTPLLQQRLETRALNAVISEFDYRYRQLKVELRQRQGIISLDMGFDNKGNAALVTEQAYNVVFERFAGFLERLQFTIVEVDVDSGRIIADYTKPEASVWDSIWGEEAMQLPLEDGQYQILMSTTREGGTSITWMDKEGEVLQPGTMNDLQQALVQALRTRGIQI
ncbi:outer membrane protein assembly factor BamC [Pseudoalteromonas ruthenica]|uniref:Outer membrane protein assembly factor BamC n=1 Tax=Pseudoalteromonas ruthenica TaxID=151081 RepID=A0A5S3Z4D2_9GAMM|nr:MULTISPECIES: outer membrane protein assembly factor BamC [Pseudoalteromonas]MCG7545010.1 outer membrane protein assembly factor BamC [Pseudoalteromonas sp. MM17-2]MCG7556990.1 outer membrane protein assembly factor BamC [Pseudoalteromonas sp. CNAT2-18.1]MCG7569466.1 outer membrane protein assembly factor BamC [Pseudoalteromonas sp. CNC9-20]MCF2861121.1 outer membrane protein assembly factor BamC [Pseudoalteromonas sp. CNAT2-18]RZF83676.1 outer membrane protein assembly factor BamC [Pseudoa